MRQCWRSFVSITLTVFLFMLAADSDAGYQREDYKGEKITQVVYLPEKRILDGIYIGAALGYDSYRTRQSVNLVDIHGTLDAANPAIATRGFVEALFAGYGRYFDC
jgi:hypothetical protein